MKGCLGLLVLLLLAGCASSGRNGLEIDRTHPSAGADSRVQFIVLHYTATDLPGSLAALTGTRVSSHYLISARPARIYQLVDENRRAWHAGDSEWQGRTWLNASTIGIELVNPGYTTGPDGQRIWHPYAEEQISTLIALLKDIMRRHGLKPGAIVAHSDIAPQRKVDPGPLFPWPALARAGLVPWPDPALVQQWQLQFATRLPDARWFQAQLARFGYRVPDSGAFDPATRRVIAAFQMRYRPAGCEGNPDAETAALLAVLNARAP